VHGPYWCLQCCYPCYASTTTVRARFIPTHTLERPRCIGAFSPIPLLTSLGESVSAKHAALVASVVPLTEDDTDSLRIALGYNTGCSKICKRSHIASEYGGNTRGAKPLSKLGNGDLRNPTQKGYNYCAIHMAAAVLSRLMSVRHGQRILYKTRAICPAGIIGRPKTDAALRKQCAASGAGAACTGCCWEPLPYPASPPGSAVKSGRRHGARATLTVQFGLQTLIFVMLPRCSSVLTSRLPTSDNRDSGNPNLAACLRV